MRTGFFAFITSKKHKAVNDSAYSFGKTVLEAVKNSKGTTEEEIAGEMKGVLDSMSILKDCEAKVKLVDVVKDCFDNKEMTVENEAEVVSTLDSMWIDIHGDSLGEIAKAFAKLGAKPAEPKDEAVNKDSEAKEDKDEDSKDETKEDKNEDSKDETEEDKDEDSEAKEDKGKDGCNKDSAPEYATKDDILTVIDSQLESKIVPMVTKAVKECLGIKEDSKPSVEGSELDSATKGSEAGTRDYASFLE